MKRVLIIFLLLLHVSSAASFAHPGHNHIFNIGGEGDVLSSVDKQIQELRQKISDAQSKEKSLKSEIGAMDNKIELTELEMDSTTQQIAVLKDEIGELGLKIGKLETSLSHLSEVLLNRIVASYKVKRVSLVPLLLSANGFEDFLNRAKYIEAAQSHDRQVLTNVQMTKVTFGEQKELREEKKRKQEELVQVLEKQKKELDAAKKTKQSLLTQTLSDEATYQKLLQQALAERQAIEAALVSGEKVGPVKTGDPIALVGNSGYPACSTGAHLHFEVRRNNQWINPAEFLKSKTISDHQNGGNATIGSGSWEWPLSDEIILTQYYGHTPYSWRYAYSGGIHTGLDMYSKGSEVIRAPKDGTLYSASQNCGGSSIIKIKYIEHGDGIVSFYLHVQ